LKNAPFIDYDLQMRNRRADMRVGDMSSFLASMRRF